MNKLLFLKMIQCSIDGKKIDLDDLYEDFLLCAKEQTYLSYIWYVSKNEKYLDYYLRTGLILERTMGVANYLNNILNENNIPHVFLKGYHLKNLYPDHILRMCGDVDILVKK